MRKRTQFSSDDLIELSKYRVKKYVRYDEGMLLYSMGRNRFIELAREGNARYKVHGVILCNVEAINEYIREDCKIEDIDEY